MTSRGRLMTLAPPGSFALRSACAWVLAQTAPLPNAAESHPREAVLSGVWPDNVRVPDGSPDKQTLTMAVLPRGGWRGAPDRACDLPTGALARLTLLP